MKVIIRRARNEPLYQEITDVAEFRVLIGIPENQMVVIIRRHYQPERSFQYDDAMYFYVEDDK